MSGWLSFLEPEEFVGSRWHRFTGSWSALPRHEAAGVRYEEVAASLPVFFRGLGGPHALRLGAAVATTSRHRLGLALALARGDETVRQARRETGAVWFPDVIDALSDRDANRKLYFWLTAFLAAMRPAATRRDDPLQRDLDFLARAHEATKEVMAHGPGLARLWAEISGGLRTQRPRRRLPEQERDVEALVLGLLGEGDGGAYKPALGGSLDGFKAARGYRPFLPVIAWGECRESIGILAPQAAADENAGASAEGDNRARKASRKDAGETERKDFLGLNRFEKMLSLVESMNLARPVEDDDEEGAKKALDDAEELSLSKHARKTSTRLKVELEIDGEAETGEAFAQANFPEWDYRRRDLMPNRVLVRSRVAAREQAPPPSEARARHIAAVRRRFEAFRPRAEILRGQPDGAELDLEAVVRARVDNARGAGSERIYVESRRRLRDMSVAVLADASLSTEAALGEGRVLDVEQEALLLLSHALTACGDEHALYAFSSRTRRDVRIETLKTFEQPLSQQVERRIFGLKPSAYTRLGAAVRFTAQALEKRPHRHRLLIVLTDGKPNDVDIYEGRYGVEDSRHAVEEARRGGAHVFGVTIDAKARDYFPAIFGAGGYAIVPEPSRLPDACVAIYRRLAFG